LTFFAAVLSGAHAVIGRHFSATRFWMDAHDHGATVISLMGSMAPILWKQDPSALDRDHRVRLAVVAPTPKYVTEFEARFGLRCTEMYGLTDVGLPLGIPAGARRPGSCGRPTPPWQCAIVDDEDNVLPVGEVGELVLRPRRPWAGSLGYWEMPEATVEANRNLWFHTGDRMRSDEEGWFYFVDRKKDAIRRSGENISSFEVEQVILGHPAVAEVAVYPVPSDLAEDEVMAALVLHPGAELDLEQLLAYCGQMLPPFALPRFVDVLAALPKTETQKVQKEALRQSGVTPTTWRRATR
ncbi:MAG TPA: AMP-binding protein, partial [Acidimicrobiales bacterium]|nr:AMP-binding protein [Acidimicrobiales bacterium]